MSEAWKARLATNLSGGGLAPLLPIVGALLIVFYPQWGGDSYWIREISLIAVYALLVSGVNLSFGFAGEIQFGQVFMFAVGAYVTMILAIHDFAEIVPLLLIGGLAATAVGALVAIPALRIGGWSLAMASFFLVITIGDFVAIFSNVTGGLNGLVGIPSPEFGGSPLSTEGLYYLTVIPAILWFVVYRNLVTSRFGVMFRILRESPVLAGSLGFSTYRLKTLAYALGAFPAGMAGCLFGFISLVLEPSSFGLTLGIGIIAASILGGTESVYGAVFGAAVLQLGPESSLSFQEYAPIVYGAFLILAAIVFRQGLAGLLKSVLAWLERLLVGRANAPAVSAPGSLANHDIGGPGVVASAPPALPGLEGTRLRVEGVSKSYGGVQALEGVSLVAEPGRVTALIGSNGSGKTTLLNVISGYAKPDAGKVTLGNDEATGSSADAIARQGVARTFQTPNIPRGVAVVDVVASGRFTTDRCGLLASILRLPRYWRTRRDDRAEALECLQIVGLGHLADEEAVRLSLGTRRLVEVARSLCARPQLLLLDEPASGLSEDEVDRLGKVILAAAKAGSTVILIEHNFRFVGEVSDSIHVLHQGRHLASGSIEEIRNNPEVVESYLGESGSTAAKKAPRPIPVAETLLELRAVESGYGDLRVLNGIDLDLRPSSVEVVLGRNGAGKTTLLSTISGQLSLSSGSMTLAGERLGGASYRRAAAGIALVQEGKRIFRNRTVRQNVMLGTYSLRIGKAERAALCDSVIDRFPILRERESSAAGGLSGGQQQMLAIAQALASRPRVLLLDEPSAGLAPAIVDEVFANLRDLSSSGLAILLVEQLAEQALAIADHVTVIDAGRVVQTGGRDDFDDLSGLQEAYFGDPTPS